MEIFNHTLIKVKDSDITNGTLTIPSEITHINYRAFEYCKNLENIVIPEGIAHIGDFAFAGCKNLKSVVLPKSITRIGEYAFIRCDSLTHVQWGNTIYHVNCVSRYCMYILHEKKVGNYNIYMCQFFPELGETVWIAEKDGITALDTSIRTAVRHVEFTLLKNRNVSEHVARIHSQGYVTAMDYCLITGACEEGTNKFLKKKHLTWNSKCTIEKVINLTKGAYGHDIFIKALKDYGCIS